MSPSIFGADRRAEFAPQRSARVCAADQRRGGAGQGEHDRAEFAGRAEKIGEGLDGRRRGRAGRCGS